MITRRLTSAFIIALLVSGVFTFWLSQKFTKHAQAPPPPPKSQYVAAAANMEAGQVIKAESLHLVDWPATVPLQGAFTTTQPLVGRMVLYPLAAGEPILERQLSAPGAGTGLTVKIPDGMRAISLRTDEIVGVAGFLLPGTHVDVLGNSASRQCSRSSHTPPCCRTRKCSLSARRPSRIQTGSPLLRRWSLFWSIRRMPKRSISRATREPSTLCFATVQTEKT